jgi:hypothetical protein
MSKKKNWCVILLRQAKVELKKYDVSNTYIGICGCIYDAAISHGGLKGDGPVAVAHKEVSDRIYDLLRGHAWLNGWLWGQHSIDPESNPKMLRATRLAWIDDMIKYWEVHGTK